MQRRWRNTIGTWLAFFAMAMLFIGPPLGQWRASTALHAEHVHHHSQHGVKAEPAGTRHAIAGFVTPADEARIGVLQLDHCGYCQLQASFAAVPVTTVLLTQPFWGASERAFWVLQVARQAWRQSALARAPPVLPTRLHLPAA